MLMRQRLSSASAGDSARANPHANMGSRKATAQRIQHFVPPVIAGWRRTQSFLPAKPNSAIALCTIQHTMVENWMSWREFWNADTPIYVNDRHKTVHYQGVARDIERLLPGPECHVADYGCGEALAAGRVAKGCAHLYLCDGAAIIRDRLRQRLAAADNVTVLSPEEFDTIPDRTVDLIVVNSVVQYLSKEQLDACLAQWRRKLTPSGRLVIADVIPPGIGPLTDAAALLRFAAANGFLIAAFTGLVRTFFSDYRRVRAQLGLAHYGEAEFLKVLHDAGFTAQRMSWNFGHNTARMAFEARASG
jgi:ubiquinone/menaquinone biosynthesis C-methylase UbiE